MSLSRRYFFAIAGTLALLATSPADAAPKAELWERWTAHDAAATTTVDHAVWDRFLKAYVTPSRDGVNRVAYARVTAADRDALETYIDMLTAIPVSMLNRDEQRVYWINLYNALTVKVVLDHYPVASIRKINISPGLFSSGPWDKELVTVEAQAVTLNDIEHRILRPIWRDPRIHYAVNCASIGCPNLRVEAFTATNAETLLDRAAYEYVNHPRGASVQDGRLIVSSIYEWFKEDFGDSDAGVIAHLQTYAEPRLAAAIDGATRVADDRYDWAINDAAAAKSTAKRKLGSGSK